MPFIAFFGVNFSDILLNICVAGLNTSLVALLLRRMTALELLNLTRAQRGWLVIVFALGSVHLTLAPYGRVWSTSQLLGLFFLILAYITAVTFDGRKAFALAGVTLAATLLTRTHMIFAGVWPSAYLLYRYKSVRAICLRNVVLLAGPVGLGCALLAAYNWFRFGNVLDSGLNYHLMANEFVNDFNRYGAFSLNYVPTNLFYQYLAYPFPPHARTFYGGSLFLLTPVFFAAFWAVKNRGKSRSSAWVLLASIVIVQVPILTLMGTGWVQFGPRYSIDFILPLLLLTAMGVEHWSPSILAILTIVSVLHYLLGTLYFGAYLAGLNNL
jgi:hypothetical protein